MAKFEEYRDEARKRLRVAEHLLTVTHPLVEDPKLLLTVLQNLQQSFQSGMDSLLEYEKQNKRIRVLPESFDPRFEIFREEVAPNHDIAEEQVQSIRDLRHVLGLHENSQVEFPRGDRFVIADEEYDLETISADKMKKEVEKAKDFLKAVDEVMK